MKIAVLKLPVPCFCLLLLAATSIARADEAVDCHVGSYRLADGSLVDIGPREDDGTYRWTRFDGTTGVLHPSTGKAWSSTEGWTKDADGISVSFPDCDPGVIDFNGASGRRVAFAVHDAAFKSHGVTLAGRLIMPKGADKVPVVVLVHGAENSSALTSPGVMSALQRMLPAEGIGVFAYDKRGTGKSGGKYTQDYDLLAADADAAVDQARRLAGARLGRIGFWGGSQGGWVAPLAANHRQVDFVIVCYGLAVNVMDEDQEAVELQMREKGYAPEVIAEALQVAHAAEVVLVSDFKQGYPELDAMRAKYGKAPWYKDVQGDFAFFVLSHSDDAELRAMAKDFDWQIPFDYDPMPTLRAGKTPQLWILGGEDYEAPSAETSRRLKSLIDSGLPFTLALYPHAEHVMTLFKIAADGSRDSTRFAPGYFRMIRDFAKLGRLSGAYGDAEITPARGGSNLKSSASSL
ncbi:MAG TPA: alpha/beta fold hydrolase [Gammaproteobacteria bacterium]|nr:alpha/beta fold hydrolase [Gammaproteobacteria bacterium]